MGIDTLIEQFADDIQFDALKGWCYILNVDFKLPDTDDEYPDWEDNLRGKIADAMMKVGK